MDSLLNSGDVTRIGAYRLLRRLGEGGMGTVYLAVDPRGRHVAVKTVRADVAREDQFRRRFRSEVNRARQVPPFCTAEVLDADPYHDPPYLVVEYIDGPNLFEVVREQGPLSRAHLHGVAVGIATALTAIHGAGVIHRDLKPGNVLFGLGGIKVIDFGIARALEATSQHTRTNQMVGTVAYMAPERFDHESTSRVGTAADIFAWGAVVAFAGTGRTPFGADSGPATAVRILTQQPELFDLEEPMRGLVERALAKDPRDRPTSRELFDDLLAVAPLAQGRPATLADTQPAGPRATPFLREVVEQAAGRGYAPPPVTPAPIPMTTTDVRLNRPARRPRPASPWRRAAGALRRFQVVAVAAVVLAVTAVVVTTLHGETSGPDDSAGAPTAPAAAPGPPSLLNGDRRVAFRLAGSGRELGVEGSGRVSLGDRASPADFTVAGRAGAYQIRQVPRDGGPAERCLEVTGARSPAALRVGSCDNLRTSGFTLTPDGGDDTYVIISPEYGVVHWSDDRAAFSLEAPESGQEPTRFTLIDRGPL